jgi:hypothetical protein
MKGRTPFQSLDSLGYIWTMVELLPQTDVDRRVSYIVVA